VVDKGGQVLIVAECCESWHDLDEAKRMIDVAHEINPAGLVKFQLHDPEDEGFTEWTKSHALTFDQAKELFDYGASIGQEVFFSVFGVKYVDWCEKIGVKRYKIACGIHDSALIGAVIATDRPIIFSRDGHEFWAHYDVLYCVPKYPALITDIDFKELSKWEYNGFSDHTVGLDAAKIALARGKHTIEKHFILRKDPVTRQFPDAKWSMTPSQLTELVRWEAVCKSVLQ
jgi:sialic acid synthase SpsE